MNLPTIEMPEPLLAVTEALEEREAAVRAAEAAVVAAREGVTIAHGRDIEEVAAAREAGKRDPKPAHEQEALAALRAAEHEHEIAGARRDQVAIEHERVAMVERPRWRERIEKRWRSIDRAQRRRIEEIAAAVGQVQELQTAWRVIDTLDRDPGAVERTLRKAMAPAAAVQVDLADVSAAIEAASADAVIERIGRARREQYERDEAATAAMDEAVEAARLEREREIERHEARRKALSE